ncbi:serine/threonine-protein kinase pknF [Mycobacterium xenopi 3993]|nr:serine/threonine-protein kinase pknF [Mycobacterium xenopi 3993]
MKPANILLTHPDGEDRRILLADFGVARHLGDISGITATNVAVGTVAYAAPEQLIGSNIDGRADQYALAATAFHLLTGVPPYRDSNPIAVIGQHLHADPPTLSDYRPDLATSTTSSSKRWPKSLRRGSTGAGRWRPHSPTGSLAPEQRPSRGE